MKTKTLNLGDTTKRVRLLGSLGLLTCSSAASGAVIVPVSYDFGTDPGKTTFAAAGFTVASGGTGQATNLAENVLLDRSDKVAGGFNNVGLLQAFAGLGGGETNNFTVTTRYTLTTFDVANANNERVGGIHLFADTANDTGINNSGITLKLIGSNGNNNDSFQMRAGLSGSVLQSSTTSLGYDFAQGDIFDLTATGTFSGTTLNLMFSVIRNGGTVQSISRNFDTVTDAALLDGTFSGVSMRIKTTTGSSFDTFSVIPEPSAFLLLSSGLLGWAMLRRRPGSIQA